LRQQFADNCPRSGINRQLEPQTDAILRPITTATCQRKPTLIGEDGLEFDLGEGLVVVRGIHGRTSGWT
jgi:hypothetical protein